MTNFYSHLEESGTLLISVCEDSGCVIGSLADVTSLNTN